MTKKRGLIIGLTFVVILITLNFFSASSSISANTIQEGSNVFGLNISILAFIILWAILIFIIILSYLKFVRKKQVENTKIQFHELKQKKSRSETDLDTLYYLLKKQKTLSIEAIAKIFKIKKEKAIEWAKILENHDLITMEYPAFSTPEIKINEKKKKKEEIKDKEETEKEDIPSLEHPKKMNSETKKR